MLHSKIEWFAFQLAIIPAYTAVQQIQVECFQLTIYAVQQITVVQQLL